MVKVLKFKLNSILLNLKPSTKVEAKKDMEITSSLAKSDDGSIQITFTIPFSLVQNAKGEALVEFAKEVEIPGFRKGKAPQAQVEAKIPQAKLIERLLGKILPKALSSALAEYKIRPAVYPKFELIKAKDNENWEVVAKTCEIPKFELGDYKKALSKLGKPKDKEQEIIKFLLETIHIHIPKILIDEEVNARLSNLLERIEKLGLSLESYLASIRKTPEILRKEYEGQSQSAISLELILEKIAEAEKIKVKESQIDEAIKTASGDPKLFERRSVATILRRRAALDSLISLL